MSGEFAAALGSAAGAVPLAVELGSNAVLLVVFAVLFFGLVVGFFTYAGSGIATRPLDRAGRTPGARRPDEFAEFAGRQSLPRDVEEVAPGVWRLGGWPPNGFNIYLIDAPGIVTEATDRGEIRETGPPVVLVDSGTRYAARRILRGLHGHPLAALVLTHGHPDHQGASAAVCTLRDIPLWCGSGDADAVEGGRTDTLVAERGWNRRLTRFFAGDAHAVTRRLREGDRVGPFVVLETPGISPGHISLWRESDGVLIAGDAAINQHPVLGRPGLHEPIQRFVADPMRNRASIQRLADLCPEVVLFGHGPPLRDPQAFAAFARSVAPATAAA